MTKHYQHEIRQVSELKPYAKNSRTHSAEQITQISKSIEEFGFTNPVLIDEAGGIIAGHCRVTAANDLGMDEVPCVVLSGLTEAQKKAYVIADNSIALNSEWDLDLLRVEVDALEALDFDIDLLGIGDDIFGGIMADGGHQEEKDLSDSADTFEVIIECASEGDQERAYQHTKTGGFPCRISTY